MHRWDNFGYNGATFLPHFDTSGTVGGMHLHPLVTPLELLIGTWSGEGQGNYPTIDAFRYRETVTFSAAPNKPFLRYEQKTQSADGTPMHTELGFLRPTGDGKIEFVLAQPTGQTESLEGTLLIDEGGQVQISVASAQVTNTAAAKQVDATKREYAFTPAAGDVAAHALTRFDMAAVGEPMQQHLVSELSKQG